MANRKCKYSSSCPVYKGALKERNKPSFMYKNVFCERGMDGWNACKRFHVYEMGFDPPNDLFPGNSDSIEHILSKNKQNKFLNFKFQMNPFTKQIKRDIINYIKSNNKVHYGDILKYLDYPAYKIMRTIVNLKQQGKVFKDNNWGQFKLTK